MSVTSTAVRHALLAGSGTWSGVQLDGLLPAPDGSLQVQRVPAVAPPFTLPRALPEWSGLAVDGCTLYVADGAQRRVLRIALDCPATTPIPCMPDGDSQGPFSSVAGLAVSPHGWLLVTDPKAGQVVVLALPDGVVRDTWADGMDRPVSIAVGPDGAITVLDAGAHRVLRLDGFGDLDAALTARIAAAAPALEPTAIAVDPADGRLYVADARTGTVLRFDVHGNRAGAPLGQALHTHALAVRDGILYVGDDDLQSVALLRIAGGARVGTVAGWTAPVTALAVGGDANLYIKPGDDDVYLVAVPEAAAVPSASLLAGPLDAGEESSWLRVAVSTQPDLARGVSLDWFADATATPGPAPGAWTAAASLDTLVAPQRYLWLRVTVAAAADGTPALRQVHAQTTGDSYMDHLPAVYGRIAADADFLDRLLELARADLGDIEAAVAALPRLAEIDVAPAAATAWLMTWLGYVVPDDLAGGAHPAPVRALLHRLFDITQRRGTASGIRDIVETWCGVQPLLVEHFALEQRLWSLGTTSALDFDTRLPARSPHGVVVGDGVVGATGPDSPLGFGSDLFDDVAHRFSVLVPAASVPGEQQRSRLERVLDEEKPAHTDYHLCLVQPRMRVGLQSRVGVDAVIGDDMGGLVLDDAAVLDLDARLSGDPDDAPGRVGRRDRLGVDTRLG